MVFLTIVNFWGCAKNNNVTAPSSSIKKTEISFSYLDDQYQISENKTDNILMKTKDIAENFSLISKKTGENEYTAIITDEQNNISVAMVYKDNKEFPDHISFSKDDNLIRGTASDHVNGAFDVLWSMNGIEEVFYNIKLSDDIYNYNNISSLDSKENYQAKTLIISLKIWDAINNYVQDSNNQPKGRFFFFIFGVIAAVAAVTAATVAVFVTALVVTAVVLTIGAIVSTPVVPPAIKPNPENPTSYPDISTFNVLYNGEKIDNNTTFTIDYDTGEINVRKSVMLNPEYYKNARLTLNLSHSGAKNSNNELEVFVKMDGNHGDPISLINAYYKFSLNGTSGVIESYDKSIYQTIDLKAGESNFMTLNIDKINKTPDNLNNVVLDLIFKNNIKIFGRMGNKFTLQIN
ncbi:colicin lysis protein [uncultured Brachyspira sp.]|uniref:colicin lysis protein n=2 Tax=Brachyspira TaxID=29521 RepID=UPI00261FA5AB|nr:colicin lysis protein [uncultured Brachyspira sp.]